LGIYGVIANFEDPKRMDTALTSIAEYTKLKKGARIVLIEDMLLVKIGDWLLDNWQQVLENNSLVSDEVFAWFRRSPGVRKYTLSVADDWQRLELKLLKAIGQQSEESE
jgi:hypothetical protein